MSFGVNGPGLGTYNSELVASGAAWGRLYTDWRKTEPSEGSFDWSFLDAVVAEAEKIGMNLTTFVVNTPLWAQTRPSCYLPVGVCGISDMSKYRAFCRALAQRYAGTRLTHFEMLNEVTLPEFFEESPETYDRWLIGGSRGIREGNPDAKVVLGGLVYPTNRQGFAEHCIRDLSEHYDIVNFHVYGSDVSVSFGISYIRSLMNTNKVSKPIWITETSTLVHDSGSELYLSARDVLKRYARAFGNGVENVFWYSFVDVGMSSDGYLSPFASRKGQSLGWTMNKADPDYNPTYHRRAAFEAYSLAASKLGGFSSVTRISDTQYVFTRYGRFVYVLWGFGHVPSELVSRKVVVTDYLGETFTTVGSSIQLSQYPIIVETVGSFGICEMLGWIRFALLGR